MMKITYLGAGSSFAPVLSKDVFHIPDFEEGEFCLVDIDSERLDLSYKTTKIVNEKLGENERFRERRNQSSIRADLLRIRKPVHITDLSNQQQRIIVSNTKNQKNQKTLPDLLQ